MVRINRRESNSWAIPSGWSKPNYDFSEAVWDKASRAINKAYGMLGNGSINEPEYQDVARLIGQMVRFEQLAALPEPEYSGQVSDLIQRGPNQYAGYLDGQLYGIVAKQASEVYGDAIYPTIAEDAWNFGYNYTLSAQEVTSGSTPVKSFPVNRACNSTTMEGATFCQSAANDTSICSSASGTYFLLSSLLAKNETTNSTYLDSAKLSLQFFSKHLFSNTTGVIDDTLSIDCKTSGASSASSAANVIEGLAILTSATQDAEFENLLFGLVRNATTYSPWQSVGGILSGAPAVGNGNLMRALTIVHDLYPSNMDLRNYVRAFVAVQYNALLNLATDGQDVYGGSWTGPPPTALDLSNQTQAIEVLLSGISVTAFEDPPSKTSDASSHSKESIVGPLVGGIVGGFFLLLVLACCWKPGMLSCTGRRRPSTYARPKQTAYVDTPTPTPPPITITREIPRPRSRSPSPAPVAIAYERPRSARAHNVMLPPSPPPSTPSPLMAPVAIAYDRPRSSRTHHVVHPPSPPPSTILSQSSDATLLQSPERQQRHTSHAKSSRTHEWRESIGRPSY